MPVQKTTERKHRTDPSYKEDNEEISLAEAGRHMRHYRQGFCSLEKRKIKQG
jgi:hypothetical protein